jgi:hypothetical protein
LVVTVWTMFCDIAAAWCSPADNSADGFSSPSAMIAVPPWALCARLRISICSRIATSPSTGSAIPIGSSGNRPAAAVAYPARSELPGELLGAYAGSLGRGA